MNDEPENKEDINTCTCGDPTIDPHPCPFRVDVHNDSETLCTCCVDCEHQCALDI